MAEAIGLASSVLAVSKLLPVAFHYCTKTCRLVETLKHAPQCIKDAADDLKICYWTLSDLERVHENWIRPQASAGVYDRSLEMTLNKFIKTCEALNILVNTFVGRNEHPKSGLRTKLRWLWHSRKDGHISDLRQEVAKHQTQLSMVLGNLILKHVLAVQETGEMADANTRRLLAMARRLRSQKPVSEADAQEMSSRLEEHLRYTGPYASPSELGSMPGSLPALSARPSQDLMASQQHSLAAILARPANNTGFDANLLQPTRQPQKPQRIPDHARASVKEASQDRPTAESDTFAARNSRVLNRSAEVRPNTNGPFLDTPEARREPSQFVFLRDAHGRMFAAPAGTMHVLHQARSMDIKEGTKGMSERESQAHIDGYLKGMVRQQTLSAPLLNSEQQASGYESASLGAVELSRSAVSPAGDTHRYQSLGNPSRVNLRPGVVVATGPMETDFVELDGEGFLDREKVRPDPRTGVWTDKDASDEPKTRIQDMETNGRISESKRESQRSSRRPQGMHDRVSHARPPLQPKSSNHPPVASLRGRKISGTNSAASGADGAVDADDEAGPSKHPVSVKVKVHRDGQHVTVRRTAAEVDRHRARSRGDDSRKQSRHISLHRESAAPTRDPPASVSEATTAALQRYGLG